MNTLNICKKVESFGVHAIKIKNNSTKNIFKYAQKALQRIEKNSQPVENFLENKIKEFNKNNCLKT